MNDLRKAAEALINHWEAGEFKNCTGDMAGHIQVLREALAQSEQRPANFYLSPPQRKWVGLTDEDYVVNKFYSNEFLDGAEWAEAKLKEKNT